MNTDKTYVSQHNKHYIIRASVIITKMEKSNKTNSSMSSLANSLGGSSSVKSSSPICSGRYNSTTAEEGLSIYNNISSCDTKIKTACSFNMTTDISKELKKCKKVMDDFRTKAEVKACLPKKNSTFKDLLLPGLRRVQHWQLLMLGRGARNGEACEGL